MVMSWLVPITDYAFVALHLISGSIPIGWDAIPEFLCGFDDPSWTAVANFTNSLANGTNTTTFPRLEAVCGSTNVLLRVRNQKQP